jgi:hypothetical protein
VFNRELRKLGDAWTKQPLTLTLAGIQNSGADPGREVPAPSLVLDAKRLLALREELAAEEGRLAERRMALAREAMARPEARPEPDSLDAASAPPVAAPAAFAPRAGGRPA